MASDEENAAFLFIGFSLLQSLHSFIHCFVYLLFSSSYRRSKRVRGFLEQGFADWWRVRCKKKKQQQKKKNQLTRSLFFSKQRIWNEWERKKRTTNVLC